MVWDAAIDAVGFCARDREHPQRERANQVVSDLARLVNPGGTLGIMGVYPPHDAHPPEGASADGSLDVPWGLLFSKGGHLGMGRTNDRRYTRPLRDLILAERVHPGRVVTHHMPLAEAPAGYRQFAERADGMVKLVFNP